MASDIEWTDDVWNPVVGCARVSPGCENCYAEKIAHRGLSPQHRGLTVLGKAGVRWTGEARFVTEALGRPLRWRKPKRVFVNSMSDLFHESLSMEQIAAVFGVMAACPQHTFQVLTKRPARALEFFSQWRDSTDARRDALSSCFLKAALNLDDVGFERWRKSQASPPWPLPNVHLGVSVEDQRRADERIPLLLQCPAALRFLSVEPLLETVDLDAWVFDREAVIRRAMRGPMAPNREQADSMIVPMDIGWVIVGGESGPGARPFDVEWARSIIAQCKAAGVPCFHKQVGSLPLDRNDAGYDGETPSEWPAGTEVEDFDEARLATRYQGARVRVKLRDRKGGDPSEWPEDLRVRELPTIGGASCG